MCAKWPWEISLAFFWETTFSIQNIWSSRKSNRIVIFPLPLIVTVSNDFLVNTHQWEELIMHNIVHDEVRSDLRVLSVLSSVWHLGTCWPLEWPFFSISMYFLHSSVSFSYLLKYRHSLTDSHRCNLCMLPWGDMKNIRTPGKVGEKTTFYWQLMNKSVWKIRLSLVTMTCSVEINKHSHRRASVTLPMTTKLWPQLRHFWEYRRICFWKQSPNPQKSFKMCMNAYLFRVHTFIGT